MPKDIRALYVFDLVTDHAKRWPSRPAVSSGGESVSYGRLVARANQLAHLLRQRGIDREDIVALCLPRGIELVVAMLGVLKSGAAYLPTEPTNPPRRLKEMCAAPGVTAVICGPMEAGRLTGVGVTPLVLDEEALAAFPTDDPVCHNQPDDLAYVIFTSGSTGRAKGVMISHRSLSHFSAWHAHAVEVREGDRATLMASPSFDASVGEIWPYLSTGAHLVVPDVETRSDVTALRDWMVSSRIDISFVPTPLAELLLQLPWPRDGAIRTLLVAGARLHLHPRPDVPFRVMNNYGPTENTVAATAGFVPPRSERPTETDLPAIGTPISGTEVYILDGQLRPVATGAVGELFLSGVGLARGYLGDAMLTADRFVPDPFAVRPGSRMYRTGDLGRWRTDGALDFCGRADDQIKVNGHRVEPAEIVAALSSHPHVRAAHVVAETVRSTAGTAGARLIAYFVPKEHARVPSNRQLREYLEQRLPATMLPHVFVVMDALPLNTNGKVDARALPAVTIARNPEAAPRTDTERKLACIWEQILQLERVGADEKFYDLGGHSLRAIQIRTRVRETFGVVVPASAFSNNPDVTCMAALIDSLDRERSDRPAELPPLGVARGARLRLPLSAQQEQIWFFQRLAPGSHAYHAQTSLRVLGPLDIPTLERALTEISVRHEILRTTYEHQPGGPVQVVNPPVPVSVPVIALEGLPPPSRDQARGEVLAEELHRPFDLARLPLARWTAIRYAEDDWELVLVEHHMVHDGWSFALLMRELGALYNAFIEGLPTPLPELRHHYGDFAIWQRAALVSPAMDAQLAHWKRRLAGAPPVLAIATDHPRPKTQQFRGAQVRFELPAPLPAALRTFARRHGVSLFTTMFAGFSALLHRYTGQSDFCVGSAFANREMSATEQIIGMFVNTVVLRCRPSGERTFSEHLRDIRDVVDDAASHQAYPFTKLVEALGLPRDASRNPLVQTMFSFHDSPVASPRLGRASTTIIEMGNGTSKLDFDVVVIPHGARHPGDESGSDGRITVIWEYNTDLFAAATMNRMIEAYVRLLDSAIADPDTRLSRLPPVEQAGAVEPNTRRSSGGSLPVHDQVLACAQRTPRAPAIRGRGGETSYGELVARAAALAAQLRARALPPDTLVGVCLPRSAELVVAELGVMMAGAAFLAVEPDQPGKRLSAIFREAGVGVVIGEELVGAVSELGVEIVRLDDLGSDDRPLALSAVRTNDLAYAIATSGSTGRPKVVMIEHAAFSNFVAWHRQEFALGPGDRTTMFYSPGFDSSLADIWPALTAGATIHVPDDETRISPQRLEAWLIEHQITVTDLPTAVAERVLPHLEGRARALRTMLVGGDRLHTRPGAGSAFRVFNQYGPTETTVTATSGVVEPRADDRGRLPAIGLPIANTRAYLLDASLQPVPPGAVGELFLGGAGVARGYLGRPGATGERFLPDPFARTPGARMYRTGDLARIGPDGALEFHGRADSQIKVRGFRIAPGEIVAALRQHPGVADAFVHAQPAANGAPRLVAHVVGRSGRASIPETPELRKHLAERLPSYMIPAAFVALEALPLSSSGKVDAAALPPPPPAAFEPRSAPGLPRTELEARVAAAWQDVLALPEVGLEDNFFDIGGHSLQVARIHEILTVALDRDFPLVAHFEHPTVRSLAAFLAEGSPAGRTDPPVESREPADRSKTTRGVTRDHGSSAEDRNPAAHIAVVGLALRLPGASRPSQYWSNLCAARESIRRFRPDDVDAPAALRQPGCIPAFGTIEDPDLFDAGFFDCAPQEAVMLDPQQRVFLECAHEALEDAGCDPARARGAIGVYAGGSETSYLQTLRAHRDLLAGASDWQLRLATGIDFLTTRVAYKLGLRGPAVTVQTGCSTSLVAIHLACQALLAGDCDVALAGGATVHVPAPLGCFVEGGVLSPDGHCRPFDAEAQGTVGSNGVGIVVLKRLADAIADRDSIRALVIGSAINNDAAQKVGFTAPSVDGQVRVIRTAHQAAGVEPAEVSYVEAHGTGTALGDPIEMLALARAFGACEDRRCLVGSVKSNIGHTDAAAGVAGFIKVVLALQHGQLPPSLHFQTPNPTIDFAAGPFRVVAELTPWSSEVPRRAGVSSFGIGGTNAHVVLEQAPPPAPRASSCPCSLLVVSAKTATALERATVNLADHLASGADISLPDAAWTLAVGRAAHRHRRFVVAKDAAGARDALRQEAEGDHAPAPIGRHPPRLVFVFPGQGGQHVGMGRELYRSEPTFRAAVDECCSLLHRKFDLDLLRLLYPETDIEIERAAAQLDGMAVAQPALFVIEVALARMFQAWVGTPAAVVGHSLGACAAAHVAGVLSLEDALALVVARGRLLARVRGGAMAAVPVPAQDVASMLDADLALAAVNGPAQCVVSGSASAVERFQQRLARRGVQAQILRISSAAHSPLVEPMLDEFKRFSNQLRPRAPEIPFISDLTGAKISREQALDPTYWAHHLRGTVHFGAAIATLSDAPRTVFLELGPGRTLSTLIRKSPSLGSHRAITTLPHPSEDVSDLATALTAAGELWSEGLEIAWERLHGGSRVRIPLPTYPWEHTRYLVGTSQERRQAAPPVTRHREEPQGASPDARPVEPAPANDAPTVPEVARIFSEVLGLPRVGANQNFFELGGDSLMATQVIARIRSLTSVALVTKVLFRAPTPAKLARAIQAAEASTPAAHETTRPMGGGLEER